MPFKILRTRSLGDDAVKTNINIIAPVLANIINMSLKYATVLAEMKHAIFARHHLKYHMYADDSQLYVDFPRNKPCGADIAFMSIGSVGKTRDIKLSIYTLVNEDGQETVLTHWSAEV